MFPVAEGHTSKQWLAQRGHAAIPTWHLKYKPQSSTFHLSSHLHIRNLVGLVGWQCLCFHTKCQRFYFSYKSECCHKHSFWFHLIIKSNSESSLWTRECLTQREDKDFGFLQNPALTPERPKISLHRLIRCHLPTHQLSCNQCMSLPTWHSLCLAQLHPDTPTLSYLWLWKSIYPWIDSVCTDAACCWSSSLNFGWLTQGWTCEKDPAFCGKYYK